MFKGSLIFSTICVPIEQKYLLNSCAISLSLCIFLLSTFKYSIVCILLQVFLFNFLFINCQYSLMLALFNNLLSKSFFAFLKIFFNKLAYFLYFKSIISLSKFFLHLSYNFCLVLQDIIIPLVIYCCLGLDFFLNFELI